MGFALLSLAVPDARHSAAVAAFCHRLKVKLVMRCLKCTVVSLICSLQTLKTQNPGGLLAPTGVSGFTLKCHLAIAPQAKIMGSRHRSQTQFAIS